MRQLPIATSTSLICASILYLGSAIAQTTQTDSAAPQGSDINSESSQYLTIDERDEPSLQQVLNKLDHLKRQDGVDPAGESGKNSDVFEKKRRISRRQPVSNEFHSLELLSIGAEEFIRLEHIDAQRVVVSLTPIDRRLRLKRCEESPVFSWTSTAKRMGNTTITARCDDSAPWKILIRAHISVFDYVSVLSVPVSKGDMLSADMVTPQLLDISTLRRETIRDIENVIGYRFKRRLDAGREISSSVLATPKVIAKGDLVQINVSSVMLDIQMKGIALSGGEVGKKINVRSNSSGRVIQTWIKGPGQVIVSP